MKPMPRGFVSPGDDFRFLEIGDRVEVFVEHQGRRYGRPPYFKGTIEGIVDTGHTDQWDMPVKEAHVRTDAGDIAVVLMVYLKLARDA